MIQALILCGGKGERLRPMTEKIPKPLIEINKKAILGYIIDHVSKFNISEIIIASGYMHERISEYVDRYYSNNEIMISNAGDVDIIARIKAVVPHVKDDLIVLYGDTLSNVDLDELTTFSKQHKKLATVTLWAMHCQFGVFETDSKNRVTSYVEKPILDKWINIGYFYIKNKGLKLLNNLEKFEEFINLAIKKNELIGFKHQGEHITVNTLKELNDAEDQLMKYETNGRNL